MKNLFKLLVFLFLMQNVNGQIIFFSDPNFKAKLLQADVTNAIAKDFNYNNIKIDTNNDGEIQQSEALLVYILNIGINNINQNIADLTGISAFVNLTSLNCEYLQLTSLDVSSLTNLQGLFCNNNLLTNLNVSNCLNLSFILGRNNQISTIDLSSCTNIAILLLANNLLTSINISGKTQLETLEIDGNSFLSNLNAAGCVNLNTLIFNYSIATIDISNCSSLTYFYCSATSSLNVAGCSSLTILESTFGSLTSLNLSGLSSLVTLNCSDNQLNSLDLSPCPNLSALFCQNNQLTGDLNLSGYSNLTLLDCSNNTTLNTINISNCNNLTFFNADYVGLTTLNASGCTSLSGLLNCYPHGTLDISNCPLLQNVVVFQCQNINVNGCSSLEHLEINDSNLTNLNLSGLTNIELFFMLNTNCNSINFDGCINLRDFQFAGGIVTNFELNHLIGLESVSFDSDNLPLQLDFSNNLNLSAVSLSGNGIENLFVKNGNNETINFFNLSTLQFICADESQVESIQTILANQGLDFTVCNSYCSFTPGGNYNTITGNVKLDIDNNGCDNQDIVLSNVRVNVNNGTNTSAVFTNNSGQYNRYVLTGNYTIEPSIENSLTFNISPSNASVNFPNNNNNLFTQDFCFTTLPSFIDLEVVLMPILPARPGFDAKYRLVYKNKGNTTLFGTIAFNYDDSVLDFVSSSLLPSSQSLGNLSWNFSNFLPLESRYIEITLNVNSPVETPPLNIGDVLNFDVLINSQFPDSLPQDNTFNFEQTVVGSYDPNNIECLEGDLVAPSYIGEYLHYGVNFENTGNFEAENVVVKIVIDPSKYNINTLQLLNTSHNSYTKITGNSIEFIFENIALESGGHGNILFKMQTVNSLVEGNSVAKRADIFFDYNAPIDTGIATTTFQVLSSSVFELDNTISIYPNPTNSIIKINCKNTIKSIQLYDIQGRLLQTQLINEVQTILDISEKTNGIYFVKITSDIGSKVEKIIKEK